MSCPGQLKKPKSKIDFKSASKREFFKNRLELFYSMVSKGDFFLKFEEYFYRNGNSSKSDFMYSCSKDPLTSPIDPLGVLYGKN